MAALIDTEFTRPAWLSSKIGAEVSSASMESMAAAGGLSAEMQRLRVQLADGSERTYVLKQTKHGDQSVGQSKQMGLVREALFYEFLLKQGEGSVWSRIPVPKVLHAEGDMATGTKVILMEDLGEATQSGHLFGPGSPLNWGKDLDALTEKCRRWHQEQQQGQELATESGSGGGGGGGVDSTVALSTATLATSTAALAFEAAAFLHAPYWNDTQGLAEHGAWLRGAGWLEGKGEGAWRGYQAHAATCWAQVKAKMEQQDQEMLVHWAPLVVECLDKAIAAAAEEGSCDNNYPYITYFRAAFRAELASRPLTLSHGDFHPANMIIKLPPTAATASAATTVTSAATATTATADTAATSADATTNTTREKASIVMLDFEQIGVGSGPQDLGQYLISHATPADRQRIEVCGGPIDCYYEKLCSLNGNVAATMTKEQCRQEYVEGGLGRWLWFLPVLNSMCPPKMTQYFHDQVLAFLNDHGITSANVPMPRV